MRIPRPIGLMNLLGGVLTERALGALNQQDPAAAVNLKDALLRDTPLGLVGSSGGLSPIQALPTALQTPAELWLEGGRVTRAMEGASATENVLSPP